MKNEDNKEIYVMDKQITTSKPFTAEDLAIIYNQLKEEVAWNPAIYEDAASLVTTLKLGISTMKSIDDVQLLYDDGNEAFIIITLKYVSNSWITAELNWLDKFFANCKIAGYEKLEYSIRIEKEVLIFGHDCNERKTRPHEARSRSTKIEPGSLDAVKSVERYGTSVLNSGTGIARAHQISTD